MRARRVVILLAGMACAACAGQAPARVAPAPPPETPAQRVQLLEAKLAAQADSLAVSRRRVLELEAEIERITRLLTSGSEREGRDDP